MKIFNSSMIHPFFNLKNFISHSSIIKQMRIERICLIALAIFTICYWVYSLCRDQFYANEQVDVTTSPTPYPNPLFPSPKLDLAQKKNNDILINTKEEIKQSSLSSKHTNLLDISVTEEDKARGVIEIDGELISIRTLNCIKKLESLLKPLGKTQRTAIHNGGCFFDAFAQGLSLILKREITGKNLRQQVSNYIHYLDQQPEEENWVKTMIEIEYTAGTYKNYKERIGFTSDESLQKGWSAPIWGQQQLEGVIFCRIYQVNLHVYEVGCIDDCPSKMDDESNFYHSDVISYPVDQSFNQKVEIALYPNYFAPIFNCSAENLSV